MISKGKVSPPENSSECEGLNFRLLSKEEIISLHDELLRGHDPRGLREPRQFEAILAAVKRAETSGRDLHWVAAVFSHEIAFCQTFYDGNKRTGFAGALLLLDKNGFAISGGDQAELLDLFLGVMGHESGYGKERVYRVLKKNFPDFADTTIQKPFSERLEEYSDLLAKLAR